MFCSCWVKCDTCMKLSVGKSAEFLCTDLFESYSSSLNCEIVTTMTVKHRQWTGYLTPYTSKSRTISFEKKNSTCGMGRENVPISSIALIRGEVSFSGNNTEGPRFFTPKLLFHGLAYWDWSLLLWISRTSHIWKTKPKSKKQWFQNESILSFMTLFQNGRWRWP